MTVVPRSAAALGLTIKIEALSEEDREAVTVPLRTGVVVEAGIERLSALRSPRRATAQSA